MLYFPNWFQQEELRHISASTEDLFSHWFGFCQSSFDLHFLNSHRLACIGLSSCSHQCSFSEYALLLPLWLTGTLFAARGILSFHLGFRIKNSVMDRAIFFTYCEQKCHNWVLRHSVWACLRSHFFIYCIWLTVSLFIHA